MLKIDIDIDDRYRYEILGIRHWVLDTGLDVNTDIDANFSVMFRHDTAIDMDTDMEIDTSVYYIHRV